MSRVSSGKVVRVKSAGIFGIEAYEVDVEVDISPGIPSFNIVGLPDSAVKESKDRVRSAVKNSGFNFPLKRIVVNLAPADIKKEGVLYDLPVAIGIISAGMGLNPPEDIIFLGELSLDGKLKKVNGIIPVAVFSANRGFKLIIPSENTEVEFAGVSGYYADSLSDVVSFITGKCNLKDIGKNKMNFSFLPSDFDVTFSDIRGHESIKRALFISACGGHNVLMIGSPGAGKTLLAKSLISILPLLSHQEEIEVMKIYSVAGVDRKMGLRPFRAPHYTISDVAMIGGGSIPRPGEVSLAHTGVLFLDELPEFRRGTLEALRIPLEERKVNISRAQRSVTFPANFQLIAAMNPCPCGNFKSKEKECRCSPAQIKNYIGRISGPLLDRFDMMLEVPALEPEKLLSQEKYNRSETDMLREKVAEVRDIQLKRYSSYGFRLNSEIPPRYQMEFCSITQESEDIIRSASRKFGLSPRAIYRILKVARTIADIEHSEDIKPQHVLEALNFRRAESFFSADIVY